MGIMTQNFQQLERSLTSEQKKTSYKKQKIREFETLLYYKFYKKFYNNKNNNPINTYSYFNIPEVKQKIINYEGVLDIIDKNKSYNKILKEIYNEFKIYYKNEIDTSNLKEEDEEEKATPQKNNTNTNTNKNNIIDFIGCLCLGFVGGVAAGKHKKYYKF